MCSTVRCSIDGIRDGTGVGGSISFTSRDFVFNAKIPVFRFLLPFADMLTRPITYAYFMLTVNIYSTFVSILHHFIPFSFVISCLFSFLRDIAVALS